MRSPTQGVLPRIAQLPVAAEQVCLIECLADSMGLDDRAMHDPDSQLAWRRLVAEGLDRRWAGLLYTVRRSLDQPPHVALVSSEVGVPSVALLAALATSLGLMADPYRKEWSRVLQQISLREDGSTTDTRWHTDSPGWPRPNDITCLLCVQPAKSGGETQVLPWSAVYSALSARPGLLDRMCTFEVPWVLDSALGAGELGEPIIAATGIRYMQEAFERAAEAHPEQATEVIDLYETARDLLDAATDFYPILLAAGDVLIFDNRRCLHRRGPMDPEDGQERTLIRARLQDLAWARTATSIMHGADSVDQEPPVPARMAGP